MDNYYGPSSPAEVLADAERMRNLIAENERLRKKVAMGHTIEREIYKDAERYRWLRDKHNDWHSSWRVYKPHKTLGSIAVDTGLSESLDDVIDKAMKEATVKESLTVQDEA
jgi:hypothetical protein